MACPVAVPGSEDLAGGREAVSPVRAGRTKIKRKPMRIENKFEYACHVFEIPSTGLYQIQLMVNGKLVFDVVRELPINESGTMMEEIIK